MSGAPCRRRDVVSDTFGVELPAHRRDDGDASSGPRRLDGVDVPRAYLDGTFTPPALAVQHLVDVPLRLELEREFRPARLHDLPISHNMDEVRLDVV